MKIAIPLANGQLCMHFGHCEVFGIYDIEDNKIIKSEILTPPPHQPGLYPRILAEKGVNLIIAGGMGMNAQRIFSSYNIKVLTGADCNQPEKVISDYINNTLTLGENACDH